MTTASDILAALSHEFRVEPWAITGQRRHEPIISARLAGYAIARALEWSYPAIGRAFGMRDKSTIIHGVKRAAERVTTDANFAASMRRLHAALVSPPMFATRPMFKSIRGAK